MSRALLIVFFISLNFIGLLNVYAQCKGLSELILPEELTPHQIDIKPQELYSGGKMMVPGESLTHLDHDKYIFLIDSNKKIYYGPRIPDRMASVEFPHMLTHRALYNMATKSKGGSPPKIVAAGEFYIRNGVVSILNNASGTFRGRGSHLKFAESVLAAHGLPMRENTQRIDVFKEPKWDRILHVKDVVYARLALEIAQDPEASALRERSLRLHRRLYARYPLKKTAGWFDYDKFLDEYKRFPGSKVDIWGHLPFLKSFLEKDGVDYMIAKWTPKKYNLYEAKDPNDKEPKPLFPLSEICEGVEHFLDQVERNQNPIKP